MDISFSISTEDSRGPIFQKHEKLQSKLDKSQTIFVYLYQHSLNYCWGKNENCVSGAVASGVCKRGIGGGPA